MTCLWRNLTNVFFPVCLWRGNGLISTELLNPVEPDIQSRVQENWFWGQTKSGPPTQTADLCDSWDAIPRWAGGPVIWSWIWPQAGRMCHWAGGELPQSAGPDACCSYPSLTLFTCTTSFKSKLVTICPTNRWWPESCPEGQAGLKIYYLYDVSSFMPWDTSVLTKLKLNSLSSWWRPVFSS